MPWWGIICYLVPGLNTRTKIISELKVMFRSGEWVKEEHPDLNTPLNPGY